ncbi:MAG: CBS domain-containing protein [Bdellovibrionaceae bacterium]|nr:CBS domain-containing protein [Pseudobdellovibrionaceae bacterium]
MADLDLFLIHHKKSITEAFETIDRNTYGAVFVVDNDRRVLGIATDGDIRRWLIKSHDMEAPIESCMNKQFVHVRPSTPREQVLKLLDHKIHVVPVIAESGHLIKVITRQFFPLKSERPVLARSRSPVRVSFGGGGSDLTHYFVENGGVVVNATINMFAHATLRKRQDSTIKIYSDDLKAHIEFVDIGQMKSAPGDFKLIASVIGLINPSFGFELEVTSEFPMGSGLGGSSAVLSSVIGCFNQFREDRWSRHEIAELAFQAERLALGMAGGWQDQYATVFGGFNFMEFKKEENIVHSLRLTEDMLAELEESLVLCYAGGSHDSSEIHKDQKGEMQKDQIRQLVAMNTDLTYKMKSQLLKGQLRQFGQSLHEGWQFKRQLSAKISNPKLDRIYDLALECGAIGGKLLGAGGGGYFLFFVEPFKRCRLESALAEQGYQSHRVTFDQKGLQSWSVREDEVLQSSTT